MNVLLFYLVVFLANIIQGITGFAGTILAMPFCLMLVGYEISAPVLNLLGFFSGVYVFMSKREYVDKKELLRILKIMPLFLVIGVLIKQYLLTDDRLLRIFLSILVVCIALKGFYDLIKKRDVEAKNSRVKELCLLGLSGLAHGLIVCGGPILIGYLSKRITDKNVFRATISTVWIFLNGFLFINHLILGMWTIEMIPIQAISLVIMLLGMYVGGLLFKIMNQRTFMIITYVLLLISGISLL